MRKKFGITLILLGVLCILFAAGLFAYNKIEDNQAGKASESVLPAIKEAQGTGTEDPEIGQTVAMVDGYPYIGFITLPTLGIELPVMDDWDYVRLKLSPCRYYGSVDTNDFVIAGHNYENHFGRLHELKIGDEVYFTDMNGFCTKYTVGDMETLSPGQTRAMLETDWDLTLYTCTYSRTARVTVRCEKVHQNDESTTESTKSKTEASN